MNRYVILSSLTAHAPMERERHPYGILTLSVAKGKDLKLRISRSFGVFAPQDDGDHVISRMTRGAE